VFPVERLRQRTPELKSRRIRSTIGGAFKFFLNVCHRIGLMHRLRVDGLEEVQTGKACIIVANHPTLIDIVALGSLIPNFNCVVKHKLRYDPFLGGCIKAAGFVRNDQPHKLVRSCLKALAEGQSVIIFPEGGRSPEKGIHKFSRGAAHLALRSKAPIVTAVIERTPPVLMKHQRWFSVPPEPCEFSVQFRRHKHHASGGDFSRQAHALTCSLEDFFASHVANSGHPEGQCA
jgi:1-acyl-sn-glycerol-3-phosphate acyltransferase